MSAVTYFWLQIDTHRFVYAYNEDSFDVTVIVKGCFHNPCFHLNFSLITFYDYI